MRDSTPNSVAGEATCSKPIRLLFAKAAEAACGCCQLTFQVEGAPRKVNNYWKNSAMFCRNVLL